MNHLTSALAVVLLSCVWSAAPLYAQRETIPAALARGSTERSRTSPSGQPPSIDLVATRTDVIVRGVLGEPRSYLSNDKINVFTEFPLTAASVLFDSEIATSKQPGRSRSLTVTQLGGSVTIGGKTFTQIEHGLPLMQPGTEGLFLLERVSDRYEIVGWFFGAFTVAGDRVRPMTPEKGLAVEYEALSTPAALGDIVSRVQKARRK